jgi:hypothetical protein
MSKPKKLVSPKRIRRTLRKNPYKVGVTAALLAATGVAAAVSRNPRLRELKDSVLRRISPRSRAEAPVLTGVASDPY